MAVALARRLDPHCHDLAIVGSLRRGSPDVADIDIVCSPRLRPHLEHGREIDPAQAQWCDAFLDSLGRIDIEHGWRLRSDDEALPEEGGGLFGAAQRRAERESSIRARYREARQIRFTAPLPPSMPAPHSMPGCPDASMPVSTPMPPRIKAEVFCAAAANYGWIKCLRTGPSDFTHALVTHASRGAFTAPNGARIGFADGCVWACAQMTGERSIIPVRTEYDLFRVLNLPHMRPDERTAGALDIAMSRRRGKIT